MSAQYRFFFDTTEVEDPIDWKSINENIKFDDGLKLRYIVKENSFDFYGAAYNYLYTQYANSFCSEVAVTILKNENQSGSYVEDFTGIIKIRDVEFDAVNCIATTKINDDNFFSLINNNKSIKYSVNAGKSKNDVTIDAPAEVDVRFSAICLGVGVFRRKRQLYTVDSCLKAIIEHITDARLDYESPYFGAGGEKEHVYVGNGYQLRVDGWSGIFPTDGLQISYDDIFKELDKKYNLGVTIDKSGVKPKIIIDEYNSLFESASSVTLKNPKIFKLSTFVDRLFGRVDIGGETEGEHICPADGDFPNSIVFYGFKRENYPIAGQCNIDRQLDLAGSWIVDHNIIFQVVLKGSDSYDTSIFLIDAFYDEDAELVFANETEIFNNGKFYWNNDLRNVNIIERQRPLLPGDVNAWYLVTTKKFKAYSALNQFVNTFPDFILQLADDYSQGFDPDNLWGNGTAQGSPVSEPDSRFTATVTGIHQFRFHVGDSQIADNVNNFSLPVTIEFIFRVYNSLDALKSSETQTFSYSLPGSTFDVLIQAAFEVGDYMVIGHTTTAYNSGTKQLPITDTYLELINSPILSGLIQSPQNDLVAVKKIYIEHEYPFSDYKKIRDNPKKYVQVEHKGEKYRGYVVNSSYDEAEGKLQLTLFTTQALQDGNP